VLRCSLFFVAFLFGALNSAYADTTLTVSEEVFGNNATSRTIAATLDDEFGFSTPLGASRPDLFSGSSGFTGSSTFSDAGGADYQVDWQLGYIDGSGPGLPSSTTFINTTTGSVTYGTGNAIQSGAPNPFRTETRLSAAFSTPGLTGIRFDFTNSPTDINQFGIFVGDLESRANNGTDGRVILFDELGLLIGDHPIRYSGMVDGSAGPTSYTSVEPLGMPTGASNNNNGDWGNATTAFLSVASDTPIGFAIIHVGDDDHTSGNTGVTEGLGLAGFQIPSSGTLTPFACDGTLFQVAESNSTLKELTFTESGNGYDANLVNIASAGQRINAGWGYNELDNFIYGVRSGTRELWRLDATGVFTQMSTLSNDFRTGSNAGDILPDGTMIYRNNSNVWQIADISDPTASIDLGEITFAGAGVNVIDFALNPNDGHIYGVDNTLDRLFYVDISGGAGPKTPQYFGPSTYTGSYGAVWYDVEGRMYLYNNNNNEIIVVNVGVNGDGTGDAVLLAVSTNEEGGINDGAYCRGPAPVPLGGISGFVFNDVDSSDIKEVGEPTLGAGILVSLFYDNGTPLDTNDDRFIGTTQTEADGSYLFDGLVTIETYRVELDLNDPNIPPGSTIGTSNPLVDIVVAADTITTDQNFGFDPGVADLSLTKTANVTSAAPGDIVVWTISIQNNGNGSPSGVRVLDVIPNGFEYISDDAPAMGDIYDVGLGVWFVDEILVNATETLNITTRALSGGTETNFAEITASSLPDPDSDFTVGRLIDDFNDGVPDDDEASFTVNLGPRGALLSGRIFNDNGAGDASAHDGIIHADETALNAATVTLYDAAETVIATPEVQPDGSWSHTLAEGFIGSVRVEVLPAEGWLTISERNAGLPALINADPHDGTFSFTPVSGESYPLLDIGLVEKPRLTEDQVANIAAGQVITLAHNYTATSPGTVTFGYLDFIQAPVDTFAVTLFEDAGCDGTIDGPVSAPFTVTGGDSICLFSRIVASSGAGPNALGTTVTSLARNDDSITVGSGGDDLVLQKSVRNLTKNTVEGTTNTGEIGDVLEYRLTFMNPSNEPAIDITINDRTPPYTALSAPVSTPVVLASGVTCSLVTPLASAPGYTGSLEWICPGSFPPGGSGSLTFQVEISP